MVGYNTLEEIKESKPKAVYKNKLKKVIIIAKGGWPLTLFGHHRLASQRRCSYPRGSFYAL